MKLIRKKATSLNLVGYKKKMQRNIHTSKYKRKKGNTKK